MLRPYEASKITAAGTGIGIGLGIAISAATPAEDLRLWGRARISNNIFLSIVLTAFRSNRNRNSSL